MVAAKRGDVRIMNTWPNDLSDCDEALQLGPISIRLGKKHHRRRSKPSIDRFESHRERRRRPIDLWVRHDAEKLVDALPGNGPSRSTLGEIRDAPQRGRMKR